MRRSFLSVVGAAASVSFILAATACELPKHDLTVKHCALDDPTSVMSKYIAKHNEIIASIGDGSSKSVSPRFYLWRCGDNCGGLGDQLKKLSIAMIAAMQTGRALLIDSQVYDDAFEAGLVDWRYNAYKDRLPPPTRCGDHDPDEGPDPLGDGCTHGTGVPVAAFEESIPAKDTTKWRKKFPTGFEVGCFVHVFFKPSAALCSLLQPWTPRFHENTVTGVYVRMRDVATRGPGRPSDEVLAEGIGRELLSNGLKCARELAGRHGPERKPSLTLFLSDNTPLRQIAIAQSDHSGRQIVSSDIVPFHTSTCSGSTTDDDRQGTCEWSSAMARGHLEAWMDLLLLASSEMVVVGSGGFSLCSASIGFIPGEKRILGHSPPDCNHCDPHGWCVDTTWRMMD